MTDFKAVTIPRWGTTSNENRFSLQASASLRLCVKVVFAQRAPLFICEICGLFRF